VKDQVGQQRLLLPADLIWPGARADPLPDRDFDVTGVAVPWRLLREAGHQVDFATERAGTVPAADPRLLDGVIFGQLGAAPHP
jgi:ThiJ/PfpI family protein